MKTENTNWRVLRYFTLYEFPFLCQKYTDFPIVLRGIIFLFVTNNASEHRILYTVKRIIVSIQFSYT